MRNENHIHIFHIMLYHFEEGWNAAQPFRDLNELFGEVTISKSHVEKWFNKFKSGDTNLADEKGRGRPSNFNDQALLKAVEEDEFYEPPYKEFYFRFKGTSQMICVKEFYNKIIIKFL